MSKSTIATIYNEGEYRISSIDMAGCLNNTHQAVIKLIRRYQVELEEFGILRFEISKNRGTQGKKTEYALLNEDQCYLFVMLSKNSPEVLKLKIGINKAFKRLRRIQKQKALPEWQLARLAAKKQRNILTDTIDQYLMPLVMEQSPDSTYLKRPEVAYCNYSKVPKVVTGATWKNRDELDGAMLGVVEAIERAMSSIILIECAKRSGYKDILKRCKVECMGLMGVLKLESSP